MPFLGYIISSTNTNPTNDARRIRRVTISNTVICNSNIRSKHDPTLGTGEHMKHLHFGISTGLLATVMVAAITASIPTAAQAAVACTEAALIAAINTTQGAGGGTIPLTPGCTYILTTPRRRQAWSGRAAHYPHRPRPDGHQQHHYPRQRRASLPDRRGQQHRQLHPPGSPSTTASLRATAAAS
jgi:hypothetical protein